MDDILVMMVLGFISVLFLWMGYLIWKKQKINLIHAYHYKKVKEEDKKAYTNLMGKAMIVIGVGMLLSDITFAMIRVECCMIIFDVFLIVGLMTYAQIKIASLSGDVLQKASLFVSIIYAGAISYIIKYNYGIF